MNGRKLTGGFVITNNSILSTTKVSPVSNRIKSVENFDSFQKKVRATGIIVATLLFSSWIWVKPMVEFVVEKGITLKATIGL